MVELLSEAGYRWKAGMCVLSWRRNSGGGMRFPLVFAAAAAFVVIQVPALQARETVSAAKGGFSEGEVQGLLRKPIEMATSGNLAGARAKFAAVLADAKKRHGDASVQAADLLLTFALSLIGTGFMPDGEARQRAGEEYLRSAELAYRAALGGTHPAVADALQTRAALAAGHSSTSEAELLLDEALKIRVATVGEKHSDTRQTLMLLAKLRGSPARTQRDPARVEAAAAAFRKLIAISPEVMARGNMGDSAAFVRLELAAMYARNGMVDRAIPEAAEARRQMLKWPPDYACGAVELAMAALERALEDAGEMDSRDIQKRVIEASPSRCASDDMTITEQ